MKIPKTDGLDWGMDWVVSWIGLNENFWTGFWTVHNYDRKKLMLSQFYGRDISSETGFLDAYLFHIIAIANLIFLLVLLFCSW